MRNITFKSLIGSDIEEELNSLAKLRIEVFKEFPYLYDGSLDYEKSYLKRYINSNQSLAYLVYHNETLIGATTCLPLIDEDEEFRKALIEKKYKLENIFYFGESIILKDFRGKGIGKSFFMVREDHAKKNCSNLEYTCFCSVKRDEKHPLCPVGYKNLHPFWNNMGYTENKRLLVSYPWKDIDKSYEDEKNLTFWLKNWN